MVQRLIALLRRPFSRRGSRKPFWERPVPEEDPIVKSSLAVPMAVSSLLLMVTLIWAFYDEGWGLRPWRAHQDEFVERYATFLRGLKPQQGSQEEEGDLPLPQTVVRLRTEIPFFEDAGADSSLWI